MIKVEIKSAECEQFTSKQGNAYSKQTGYAYTVDRSGNEKPYPEEIRFMPAKDNFGVVIPYKPGMYEVANTSFRVGRYGDLEIGFLNLQPVTVAAVSGRSSAVAGSSK